MKNKTDRVTYPYYTLSGYLQNELETLRNSYRRKKEQAFFNQCRYAKKKSQQNRYKMNCSFLECSEYKHIIRQVEKWIKDLDKERDLQKENERLKQQIEEMKCCGNCNKYNKEFNIISSMCFGCKNKSKWELGE